MTLIFDFAGPKTHPFHVLSASIAVLAAVLHVAFFALFLWFDIKPLAILNVASVASHVLALYLINHNHEQKGFMLIVAEVAVHAVVATYYAGWSSGFHYYFILVVPMIGLSNIKKIRTKIFYVIIAIVAYVIFDFNFRLSDHLNVIAEKASEILYYFNMLAVMITLAFIAFCYHYLISRAENDLVVAANTDPLTKLSNRRCFMQAIDKEMTRSNRAHFNLSFIICDLDYFKMINDRHGHEAGDMVLKAVGQLLNNEIRHCDKLSRWGGEEFLIMLPDATIMQASVTAESLRKKVENLRISYGGENLSISMTLGVASLTDSENPEHAIARADTGLYKGKSSGRNCVVLV